MEQYRLSTDCTGMDNECYSKLCKKLYKDLFEQINIILLNSKLGMGQSTMSLTGIDIKQTFDKSLNDYVNDNIETKI